jgi:hypothetical protein
MRRVAMGTWLPVLVSLAPHHAPRLVLSRRACPFVASKSVAHADDRADGV